MEGRPNLDGGDTQSRWGDASPPSPYDLTFAFQEFFCHAYLEHILPTGIIEANVIKPMTPNR